MGGVVIIINVLFGFTLLAFGESNQQSLTHKGFPRATQKPQEPELADIDCSIKSLAWEYAQQIQPWHGNFDSVFDALQLADCDLTPSSFQDSADIKVSSGVLDRQRDVTGIILYVDSVNGSDENDGDESSPLATIQKALDNIRTNREADSSNSIILRDTGVHWLHQSLVLSALDSGLSIMAYSGETPIVSGGVLLNNLEWETWTPSWLS